MSAPENPPAFPNAVPQSFFAADEGMSLPDWFAGQALVECSSLISVEIPGTIKVVAKLSYDIADAMLKARASTLDDGGMG